MSSSDDGEILGGDSSECPRPLLRSFGVAKSTDRDQAPQTRFLAPELQHGAHPTTASDVFALGKIFDFVTYRRPNFFEGVPELAGLIKASIAAEPESRPTASAVVNSPALQQSLQQGGEDPPEYWDRDSVNGLKLHPVGQDDPHYKLIAALLTETCCGDRYCLGQCARLRLVRVQRAQNPFLWKSYAGKREMIRERLASLQQGDVHPVTNLVRRMELDLGVNEVYLLHGSCEETVQEILTGGFDERHANKTAKYGTGTYFASQVCKAMQYSRAPGCNVRKKKCGSGHRSLICQCRPWDGKICRQILLCRVVLGRPYWALKDMVNVFKPPDKADSIVVDPTYMKSDQAHDEFVVWGHIGAQAYPEYVIDVELK